VAQAPNAGTRTGRARGNGSDRERGLDRQTTR
jgi:hypothetical protein